MRMLGCHQDLISLCDPTGRDPPTLVDPVGGYATPQDELIARAPIRDNSGAYIATYLTDRAKVWEKISSITRAHNCWSYVRPAQHLRDGCMAFFGLRGHYLGVNNVDNMSTMAEMKLTTTLYTMERSAAGTLSAMQRCIRTNMQSFKDW
jgi:hypothetical protein